MSTNAFVRDLRKAIKSKKERALPRKKPLLLHGKRESPFWRFDQNGLSVSAIELWLICREQFRLKYAEGLRCPKSSAALDYGNLWHWLLARAFDPKIKKAMDLDTQLRVCDAEWREENPLPGENRRQDWQLSLAQARVMWPFYSRKYKGDWTQRQWRGVEVPFQVDYSRCGKTFLHGIWDGVFQSKGKLWLSETKTKSQIDEYEIEDTLHLDNQVMLYLWTIWQNMEMVPAGVEYNVIRKPGSKPKAKESLQDYTSRLQKELTKDEDHYFKRWQMAVSKKQIQEWEESQLFPIMRAIKEWTLGGPHFINTKGLIGKYGRCEMFDVITKGDLTNVTRRKETKLEKDR